MDGKPDPQNHEILRSKILSKKEQTVPIILEELKKPKTDAFVELGIRIIHSSAIECSEKIIELITKYIRVAYSISQLCMLLGFHDNSKSIKVFWRFYT
jgi:hypothetical protein